MGATGSQLLLDGVPLEGSPAEKQFAQLLSSAGLASVQFFPSITEDELSLFARAFPTGKAKPSELAEQLKASLAGAKGVRINEVCFVATDSRFRDANRVRNSPPPRSVTIKTNSSSGSMTRKNSSK